MSNNMFGVYEDGGEGVDSRAIDSITPSGLFDNLDSSQWFDQTFKMEPLTDSMILDAMRPVTDYMASAEGGGTATMPKRATSDGGAQYAELTNVSTDQREHHQQQHRDDDGYGSQTIYLGGLMDSPTADDDFAPFTRERCHTWPSIQRNEEEEDRRESAGGAAAAAASNQRRHHHPYQRPGRYSPSGLHSRTASGLSLISESNESLAFAGGQQIGSRGVTPMTPVKIVDGQRTAGQWMLTPANLDERSQEALLKGSVIGGGSGTMTRHSSGSDSAEPVPAKQTTTPMTMANYKAGHPSYVELITTAINSSPEKRMTLSEIYDWMVSNVPAFKDQRYLHSSSGWKNSVRHNLSLHSRFKRVKRNGMDKPSWWTVDMTEEIKRERSSKRPTKATGRPRANTTTAAIYHPPQPMKTQQNVANVTTAMARAQQQVATGQMLLQQGSQSFVIDAGRRGSLQATGTATRVSKTQILTGTPVIGVFQDGEYMEWTQYAKMEVVEAAKANLSQAITVTMSQAPDDSGSNAGPGGRKTDIALTITVGDETVHPSIQQQGSMSNLVNAFRQNTLDEAPGRQLLRVRTNAGQVQEVAVPIPMPIRVVTKAHMGCQTDTEPIGVSMLASGQWMDQASIKHDQLVTSLDELMALSEVNGLHQGGNSMSNTSMPMQHHLLSPTGGHGQQHQQQQQSSGALSPSEMLNTYFQPNEMATNSGQKNPTSTVAHNGLLPEDLAALEVRDAFDCDIMDILSFDLNCNGNQMPNGNGGSGNGASFT